MSEKVACSRCGGLILLSIAARTGGLYRPCKGGHRDRIDDDRRRAREEREQIKSDPHRQLWLSLVKRVHHPSGPSDVLSHAETLYFAVSLLLGDVYNGGFHQYFFNDSGSYYALAEEGLIALGAFNTLALLHAAKEVVFPGDPVPTDVGTRRTILRAVLNASTSSLRQKGQLDALDKLFWADSEAIEDRLDIFARSQGLLPE